VTVPAKVTAIICTYNRAQTLAPTVVSLLAQKMPENVGWEILIVDNNSKDETRAVVEDFQKRFPRRVRYLFESKQGLSHARNAGIQNANGQIIAFIDDDETADPEWLVNLTSNLGSCEWAGAGGRVLPPDSFSRPKWLSSNHSFIFGPISIFDRGTAPTQLCEPPFGANMAYRKDMFEKYGLFRTDLGRVGTNLISNEDTEFGRRLIAGGERLRYEPAALTFHPVEKSRMKKKYFLSWWFNKGRSDVREAGNSQGGKHILGGHLKLIRDIVVETVRWGITSDPSDRFVCKLKIWAYAGQGYESWLQWRGAKAKRKESAASAQPPASANS